MSAENTGAWTCFHCAETFTDPHNARLHFGRDERSEAACVIKGGAEGSLLKALRDAEYQADDAIQRMHDESTDAAKAYHQQRCRHTQALIAAEELGYERGLSDGLAPTQAAGWQDIASAPRDGSQILVDVMTEYFAVVSYWSGGFRETANGLLLRNPPKRWMPIPTPPSEAKGGVS